MRDGGKSQELGRGLSRPLPTCAASLPAPPAPEDSSRCRYANDWVEMALSILALAPTLQTCSVTCGRGFQEQPGPRCGAWSSRRLSVNLGSAPPPVAGLAAVHVAAPVDEDLSTQPSSSLSAERQPLAFPAHLGSWRRQEITPSECGWGDSRITGPRGDPGFTASVCLWLFSVPRACVSSTVGRAGAALRPRPGPAGPEKWGHVDVGAQGSWPGGQSAPPGPQKGQEHMCRGVSTRTGPMQAQAWPLQAVPAGLLAGVCPAH